MSISKKADPAAEGCEMPPKIFLLGVSAMKKENISDAVIRRLPRYYRQLTELHNRGIVRISSHSLGQEMNITASQIRQDFSCFGEFGQQGYGYNVEELRTEIGHILGVDNNHHLIMIGVGNLGRALLRNFPFSQTGFSVDAAFDVSVPIIGSKVNGIPVYAMDDLEQYLKDNVVDVVVMTIPQEVAQEVADRLIALGVRGFWNFTNVELSSADPNVKFENIHFADSLLTLSYRIANQ
jgi:redox-sensing transcriptional repressor